MSKALSLESELMSQLTPEALKRYRTLTPDQAKDILERYSTMRRAGGVNMAGLVTLILEWSAENTMRNMRKIAEPKSPDLPPTPQPASQTDKEPGDLELKIRVFENFLNRASLDQLSAEANQLHEGVDKSKQIIDIKLRHTAFQAWKIGKILAEEKKCVGHGEWGKFCEKNHPKINPRTIRNYMRLGAIPKTEIVSVLKRPLTEAYRIFNIIKPKQLESKLAEPEIPMPAPPEKPKARGAPLVEGRCPRCGESIAYNLKTQEFVAVEEAVAE